MTTTFFNSPLSASPSHQTLTQLHAIFVEPLLVAISCLFWLIALPIGGLLCISVALFDRIASLSIPKVRLLDLRSSASTHPLVLRRGAAPAKKVGSPTPSAAVRA